MYELVAYIMRYWFSALMLVILWRAIHWIRYETNVKAIEKKMLPDAGHIGEWAVLYGADKMEEGCILSAPGDGFLGSGRTCDVRIPVKGVPKRAARFYFRRDGLHLLPLKQGELKVDGKPVKQEAVLRHGATLSVEGIVLQFRLFAGILLEGEAIAEVPSEAETQEEASLMDGIGMESGIWGHPDGMAAIELPKPAFQVIVRRRRGSNSEKRTDA